MRKIGILGLSTFLVLFSLFSCARAEMTSEQLIEKYVHDRRPADTFDWISPYYFQIADKGSDAVEPLLAALNKEDPLYVENRLDFVFLLGMIGDARAYSALRIIFLENKDNESRAHQERHKWRTAISLGASLTVENVDDYVGLMLADTTGGALQALREMSGQDFGIDKEKWISYLSDPQSLETFRENCRGRSAPIIG